MDSGVRIVGVMIDKNPTFHAENCLADYDTLCGIDANDPVVGHCGFIDVPRNQKITCQECYTLWRRLTDLQLKETDFKTEGK